MLLSKWQMCWFSKLWSWVEHFMIANNRFGTFTFQLLLLDISTCLKIKFNLKYLKLAHFMDLIRSFFLPSFGEREEGWIEASFYSYVKCLYRLQFQYIHLTSAISVGIPQLNLRRGFILCVCVCAWLNSFSHKFQ